MYLRRNRVTCGASRRTYLSIAHNVWWFGDGTRKAQSRPVVIATFGVEDQVDVELARDLVDVVEKCAPKLPYRRGEAHQATTQIAREIRKIEPFLKALVNRGLAIGEHLPPHPERSEILEALVREQLVEPIRGVDSSAILTQIKHCMAG